MESEKTALILSREVATQHHHALIQSIIRGGDIDALMPQVATAAVDAGIPPSEQRSIRIEALAVWGRSAIDDDVLSEAENDRLRELSIGFELDSLALQTFDERLACDLMIAGANAGFLHAIKEPHLMAKKNEIVHMEWPVNLMKEVTIREYRGGYSGFSFPIGKTGIRYRTGSSRGRLVELGKELQVADSGLLAVSNMRAVFIGSRKTTEMPYTKLVNLSVFSDGLQFHLSNRVNAVILQVQMSDVVAATINAAARGS